MKLYLDGGAVSSASAFKTIAARSNPLRMGHWASEWYSGVLDEVRVFSRALTGSQIAALVAEAPAHVPGPILEYDMENITTDGRMKDLSGHGNHGVIFGSADVAGRIGRARQLNRTDYIAVPDSSDLHASTGITIAAWVFLQADHANGTATMIRKQGSFLLELGDNGTNRPTFFLWWSDGTAGPILSGPPVPKFEWHHLAATYDGTQMRLYLDGGLVNSLAISRTIATSLASLRIGHFGPEWFAGIIDEVRIYSRSLTDGEIASVASGTMAQPDQGNSYAAIGTSDLTFGLYASEVPVFAVTNQEIVNLGSVDGASSGGLPALGGFLKFEVRPTGKECNFHETVTTSRSL